MSPIVRVSRWVALGIALWLVGFSPRAVADQPAPGSGPAPAPAPAPPPAPDAAATKPWAVGVSEEQQALALAFFEEGNREFQESRFAQALEKYRKAIDHWDHPAIRFNMAVCMINLELLVEAKDNLEKGLAYGPAPLDPGVYAQGLTYRKLLEGRLVVVTIRCKEAGAEVYLNGKQLFVGPGERTQHLMPGDHQIVATKPGFITASERLTLAAGTSIAHDVRLVAFKATTTRMVRRWERWKPWAVIGGGAAGIGVGALVLSFASNNYSDYDAAINSRCPRGCTAEQVAAMPEVKAAMAKMSRAEWQQTLGASLAIVGGATVAVGVVGLVFNMQRSLVVEAPVAITPIPGGAMANAAWRF